MKWKYTTILHPVRIAMGLTPNEYCVLDVYYQSQTHNGAFSVDGWAQNSYAEIASFLGFSKGAIFKMTDRFVSLDLLEVNEANPKQKRTTKKWFQNAYLKDLESEELEVIRKKFVQKVNGKKRTVQKVNVQKVNDAVQKVNDERSISERNRSISERQEEYKLYKQEYKLKYKQEFVEKTPSLKTETEKEEEKSCAKKEEEKGGSKVAEAVAVIEYLNELTGSSFSRAKKGKGSKNVEWVLKLLKKGYSLEELKLMIEYKFYEWHENPKMAKFLQPVTLFKRHGETYIEQATQAKENPVYRRNVVEAKKSDKGNSKLGTGEITSRMFSNLQNF